MADARTDGLVAVLGSAVGLAAVGVSGCLLYPEARMMLDGQPEKYVRHTQQNL